MSLGLWPRVHGLPGNGRMFSALVRCDPSGTNGVSDQEAAGCGRNTLREGAHLPSGKVCGQDSQETLLGKIEGWWKSMRGNRSPI